MWKPDIVILGPGGIKGFLELGVLYALQNNNLLENVHTYVGVSVGSIISLLLVCGFARGSSAWVGGGNIIFTFRSREKRSREARACSDSPPDCRVRRSSPGYR